jgi:hypothetical protein
VEYTSKILISTAVWQAMLEEREKKKPHLWEFRSPEEAAKHWNEEFGHLQD